MFDLNRREFIRKTFRLCMFGGLATIGFKLGTRSSDSKTVAALCEKPSPCQKCQQFAGCTQPRALAELKKSESKSDSLHIVK